MKRILFCFCCLCLFGCAPETYSAYRVESEIKLAQEDCSTHMGVARYGIENDAIHADYPIESVYCNDESSFDISYSTSKFAKIDTK